MNTKHFSLLAIALVLTFASCKRENPSPEGDDATKVGDLNIAAKDLVVAKDFDFSSEKTLEVKVAVADAKLGERYIIKIYNNVPTTGDLMTTGITDENGKYSTTVKVPAWEEFIFIEKINPDGSSYFEKVKANQFVNALLKEGETIPTYIVRKTSSGMNCSVGCTKTVNNSNNSTSVGNGEIVCYTGNLSNANITVNKGGVAKICASGTISSLTINGTGKVYILENTTLRIINGNFNDKANEFYSWSDSLIFNTGNANGIFNVYGKTYFTNTFNPNSFAVVKNYGTLSVTSNVNLSKNVCNFNKFIVGGNFTVNSSTEFNNYCCLVVNGNFTNSNGDIYNNSYIKVLGTYIENSNGSHIMDNGALLSVKNMELQGEINGTGTNRSKIKVEANTKINTNGKLSGKIDYCDSNGIEQNNGSIVSPAALSCTGYIATSTCNPEGFGTPPVADCDNDGIPDTQDEYPCDPKRAFNSYYPNANSTATLAFEDLWPATGDYDYNDLVLAFNVQKVLDKDNKVVDYKVKMKVLAVGATFTNGFGWQFDDVLASEVNSVAGQLLTQNLITRSANGTEASQTKAVIIAYDSPEPSMQRVGGSFFNTIPTNGIGTSDTIRIDVNFATPVADSKLSISKFNPFIFANKKRDNEIHLGNFKPTDLANTSMFGQWNDRSNPSNGIYYKTGNGMPWAILLPNNFVYPKEYSPITSAYNFFDDWAASGGTNSTNWYTDAPGNRNPLNLFGLQ